MHLQHDRLARGFPGHHGARLGGVRTEERRDRLGHAAGVEIRADDVEDGFLTLASAQPELRVLCVSGREISGAGLAELGTAPSLRDLHLIDAGQLA